MASFCANIQFVAPYLVGWGNFSNFVSRNGAAALFYLIEKVLLKLSSIFKLRNFDFSMKMIAMAPHQLVCTAIIGSLHNLLVWVAIALSMLKVVRRPEYRIKQI